MVLATATPDVIVFAVAAIAILIGALGVVLSRHPVHSALMLVLTLFGVAVEFINQQADFLAAVQVIVYAGAIVILFLFVIMLLGVDREENLAEPLPWQRPAAIVLGLMVLVELALLARLTNWATGAPSVAGKLSGPGDNIQKLGQSIFTRYLFGFEITSVLLVIAVVGAVILARRPDRVAAEMTHEEQQVGAR